MGMVPGLLTDFRDVQLHLLDHDEFATVEVWLGQRLVTPSREVVEVLLQSPGVSQEHKFKGMGLRWIAARLDQVGHNVLVGDHEPNVWGRPNAAVEEIPTLMFRYVD